MKHILVEWAFIDLFLQYLEFVEQENDFFVTKRLHDLCQECIKTLCRIGQKSLAIRRIQHDLLAPLHFVAYTQCKPRKELSHILQCLSLQIDDNWDLWTLCQLIGKLIDQTGFAHAPLP